MPQTAKNRKYITSLRSSRTWHRWLGLFIAILLLISSVTGVLLAWKKNSDLIQPPTQKGVSKDISDWLPLDSLYYLADNAMKETGHYPNGNEIDRMDVRPSKGIVKMIFKEGNWEIQLDGTTGEVKSVAKRYSDWIESLHDGSIINDAFKFVSMNFLGIALLFMICTGLWLWYGPKLIRKARKKTTQ